MTAAARAALVWAVLALAAAAIAAHARYTADMSAFLPRRASATQRLLVQQLREGPAAHLVIAAIEGADAATRAQVSSALAALLRSDPAFMSVNNGDAAQLERDEAFLFEHRYLLSPQVRAERFTVSGLHAAIGDSLAALTSAEGVLLKPLFTRDPTGELRAIIDSLDAESHAAQQRRRVDFRRRRARAAGGADPCRRLGHRRPGGGACGAAALVRRGTRAAAARAPRAPHSSRSPVRRCSPWRRAPPSNSRCCACRP